MNKNGVIAVVVVVVSIVLVGLWAMRSSQPGAAEGCAAPPEAPTGVTHSVQGSRATLGWDASRDASVTTFIIEAGSTPGANNQGTFVAPATATTFDRDAPPGTYYVRMYARNACGTSPASDELTVTIP